MGPVQAVAHGGVCSPSRACGSGGLPGGWPQGRPPPPCLSAECQRWGDSQPLLPLLPPPREETGQRPRLLREPQHPHHAMGGPAHPGVGVPPPALGPAVGQLQPGASPPHARRAPPWPEEGVASALCHRATLCRAAWPLPSPAACWARLARSPAGGGGGLGSWWKAPEAAPASCRGACAC